MDKNTYMKLLETHRDRIYSYCLYCLRHQDDAEDLTQEVFLRLWKQGPDFQLEKAEAWLIRVAHNLVIDHSRRRKSQATHLGRPDPHALDQLVEPDGPANSPERHLQQANDRQEILNAMATLQEETRSVMLMHYFQGLGLKEIAQVLGKKTSTVKVQVHRARKALRLVLEARTEYPLAAKRETG